MTNLATLMREEGAFIVIDLDHSWGGFRASLVKSDSRSHSQSMVMLKGQNVTGRAGIPEKAVQALFDELANRAEGDK